MITVRFIHPGTGAERASVLSTLCPICVCEFQPAEHELQVSVGDAIEVHCPECDALALRWSPPQPPPPEPEPEPQPDA